MRNRLIIGIVATGLGLGIGCGSGGGSGYGGGYGGGGGGPAPCSASTATATNAASMSGYSFAPSCIKINAGQAVTWTNSGSLQHTVTSDGGDPAAFDSGTLNPGQTFSYTFTMTGTYNYHCAFHVSMGMTGTVIVQ